MSDCEVLVQGDYDALRRAIGHIVSNAIKFTTNGSVSISIRNPDSGKAESSIADTGIGMTEMEVLSIIEPFRQADNRLSRGQEGCGLGVPLAKALLKLHNGELDIRSEPGIGTTVTVILPTYTRGTGRFAGAGETEIARG